MAVIDPSEFRQFVLSLLAEDRPDREADIMRIGDDQDMFETGVLDSHTFIKLCLAIEERTGIEIDIAQLDPENLSSIHGLHKVVREVSGQSPQDGYFETIGPRSNALLAAIVAQWPRHQQHVENLVSLVEAELIDDMEDLADLILRLADSDLSQFVEDYQWMCGLFIKHELAFRRNGVLEHSDTQAIKTAYYDAPDAMGRYMRGLLLSQIAWWQHLKVQLLFKNEFLPRLTRDFSYMEVGPGHGIALAMAASRADCVSLTGLDISQTSLEITRTSLARLGVVRQVELVQGDICGEMGVKARFDAISIAQVLELVESPARAVATLAACLNPSGLLFVNCPIGMLAPDHIRIWQSGDDVAALLTDAGLTIEFAARVPADTANGTDEMGYSQIFIARKSGTAGS